MYISRSLSRPWLLALPAEDGLICRVFCWLVAVMCKASAIEAVAAPDVVSDELWCRCVGFITARIDKGVLAHPIVVLHALYMLVVLQRQCSSLLT